MPRRKLCAAALGLLAAALAVTGARAAEVKFEISLSDYRFEPDRIIVRPGDTVTITLINKSRDREHEFMVGRKVELGGPFGDRPEGYEEDFFNGLQVEVLDAEGVTMLMEGKAKLTGMGAMGGGMSMGDMGGMAGMEMDEDHGFMVQVKPGGKATIRFTVPANRAGEWQMGCFAEDGQHYDEGMKGSFVVRS